MQNETIFLLDEAGQLGHMPALDQAVTLLRSYGVRMVFCFQSIGQLHETFKGKESVLLDNTEQFYFGLNSYETAERVSKMLGSATITVEDASTSTSWQKSNGEQGGGSSASRSASRSWKEHGRPLLMPEEVLRLHGDHLIAFLRNLPPILCRRVKWWELAAPRKRIPVLWWGLVAVALGLVGWAMWRW